MPSWIKKSTFWKNEGRPESKYDLLEKDDESGETSFSGSGIDVSLISEQMVANTPSSHSISKGLAFSVISLQGTVILIMAFFLWKQTAWHPNTPVPDCKALVNTYLSGIS